MRIQPLNLVSGWVLAGLAMSCLVLGAVLWHYMRRWWLGRRLTQRFRRARQSEGNARAWLERRGFTILDAQVTQGAMLIVDGTPTPFSVRADYLVQREGVRGVVEVKTGSVARPAARETRRQVLEYAWVYGVSEVYLFDADAEVLRCIAMPGRPHPEAVSARSRIGWAIGVAFVSGAALATIVWWYSLGR